MLREQPRVRCCAVLPSRPDHELGYEYLPEEECLRRTVRRDRERYQRRMWTRRRVDLAHLQCAGGVCPI